MWVVPLFTAKGGTAPGCKKGPMVLTTSTCAVACRLGPSLSGEEALASPGATRTGQQLLRAAHRPHAGGFLPTDTHTYLRVCVLRWPFCLGYPFVSFNALC